MLSVDIIKISLFVRDDK